MNLDQDGIRAKAINLLERVADSVYQRERNVTSLVCFSSIEVQVVESWIEELISDLEIPP
jgi:hypothetical protein